MNDLKVSLGVLQRISEFLADLPESQLLDLADGKARLAYVPVGSDQPAPSARSTRSRGTPSRQEFVPSQTTVDTLHRFESLGNRDEAAAELRPMGKPALLDIAKALSVPRASSLSKDHLTREIVEATVGRRLDSIAIRGFEGPRP
jgi:hypothetical protein